MSEYAFEQALKAFNKARTSVHQALRIAINEYLHFERDGVCVPIGSLTAEMANTDEGENTALVIRGFRSAAEINAFVEGLVNAPRK